MKHYAPENASFLLPFEFDPARLVADLEKCRSFDFLENYIPANYQGKDYILPLRSIEGRLNAPAALPDQAHLYADTEALKQCTYFKGVIDTFQCKKEAVRLMRLPAGKVINTHIDYDCGYEDGVFRVHVPVLTNKEVYFILNDKRLVMNAGQAWYTNVNLPHSVANKGTTDRVHLVIDCIRNQWSDEVFGSLGYRFDLEREIPEEYSKETLERILYELSLQDTDVARDLSEKLKSKV